ncbi:MAG: PTS transporter subunit EIIC [Lachnospiraceae bacterium]|jgi:glucose-specific phosphotransferase system IIA component|nr:PTS transporter subunit EIIC [Lachnospiraceae bacterium]
MKDKIFGVLQRVGRSFMLPIAILPVAGLFLGIGGSFTNATMVEAYGLTGILGEGTFLHRILTVLNQCGDIVFANLPIIFAMGVAIGMAKKEKDVAALSGAIAFFIMHAAISAMLSVTGVGETLPNGSVTTVVGIESLQMGVFGGILVGLGVAALHNRFYKIQLPQVLSFFGGTRFVPIISAAVYMVVGILMFYIWPVIQNGIYAVGDLVRSSGYAGTFLYGLMERALIPFGLHHVFYLPFWQTAVGGTAEIGGRLVEGAQNIFFAELADGSITRFSVEATRFMAGKFPMMIFGLPGAALAMYHTSKPEKRKLAGSLLMSAALTSMLTGITEPLEFTFLFVAPLLYVIHAVLAGAAYMFMHIFQVGVGMTFSGGMIDLTLFGIMQGNAKTNWLWVVAVGICYFIVYYFLFSLLIRKLDLKTPGREDSDDVKLYRRSDVEAKKADGSDSSSDPVSELICQGLGGKKNISDVDCCATRLRCTVYDSSLVSEALLKSSGASGVIRKGQGVQVIYGPSVTVIKSNFEDYLVTAPDELVQPSDSPQDTAGETTAAQNASSGKTVSPSGADIASARKLLSPVSGTVAPIDQSPDEAFASRIMGDGYMVSPDKGLAVAPEDCQVVMVFPTGHALGLKAADGLEYLIHIGVDTVALEGKGFTVHVSEGDFVKKGDKLVTFDLEYIRKNAKSDACMIVLTSLTEGQEVHMEASGQISQLSPVASVLA